MALPSRNDAVRFRGGDHRLGLDRGQRDDAQEVIAAIGDRLEAIAGGSGALTAVAEQIARALRLPFVALTVPWTRPAS